VFAYVRYQSVHRWLRSARYHLFRPTVYCYCGILEPAIRCRMPTGALITVRSNYEPGSQWLYHASRLHHCCVPICLTLWPAVWTTASRPRDSYERKLGLCFQLQLGDQPSWQRATVSYWMKQRRIFYSGLIAANSLLLSKQIFLRTLMSAKLYFKR